MGIAVGGAMAAAFVSMGTASADDLVAPATDDGAFTDLAQLIDPNALTSTGAPNDIVVGDAVAAAALPAQTLDAFETLVETIDPNAFTATGAPNDYIGTLASQIDSDLVTANTIFGPELNQLATQITCADNPTCEPTLLITPTADDDPFTDLEQFVAQDSSTLWNIVLVPSLQSDLATIAGQLDTFFAPTVFGPELDTIADQIIGAFTTTTF